MLSEDAGKTGSRIRLRRAKNESAAVDGPRRHSRSARRVSHPCLGQMSTSVFVIDRGSRTTTKPDVQQCRCGSDTLWLYASGAVTTARIGTTRIQCRACENFRKPPIPESRENHNIAGGQKTEFFDYQYHPNFGGFIPVCRAFKIFLAPAKQRQRPRYIFLINAVLAAALSVMAPAMYRPYDRGGPSSGPDGDEYVLGSQQPGTQVPGRRHL